MLKVNGEGMDFRQLRHVHILVSRTIDAPGMGLEVGMLAWI